MNLFFLDEGANTPNVTSVIRTFGNTRHITTLLKKNFDFLNGLMKCAITDSQQCRGFLFVFLS